MKNSINKTYLCTCNMFLVRKDSGHGNIDKDLRKRFSFVMIDTQRTHRKVWLIHVCIRIDKKKIVGPRIPLHIKVLLLIMIKFSYEHQ